MEKLNQTATERRRITRNRLYRYLYDAPQGHSKQEMADDLGLSMPTVHQNLAELLQAELVRANGVRGSTGGRRATQIAVAGNARGALGGSVSGDPFPLLVGPPGDLPLRPQNVQPLRVGERRAVSHFIR